MSVSFFSAEGLNFKILPDATLFDLTQTGEHAKKEYRYSKNSEQSEDRLHDELSSFDQIIKNLNNQISFQMAQFVLI